MLSVVLSSSVLELSKKAYFCSFFIIFEAFSALCMKHVERPDFHQLSKYPNIGKNLQQMVTLWGTKCFVSQKTNFQSICCYMLVKLNVKVKFDKELSCFNTEIQSWLLIFSGTTKILNIPRQEMVTRIVLGTKSSLLRTKLPSQFKMAAVSWM